MNKTDKPKKFSETKAVEEREPLYPEVPVENRCKVKDILKKDITVISFTMLDKAEDNFGVMKFSLDGKDMTCAVGSKVLQDQLGKSKDDMPWSGKIIEKKSEKSGRMYMTFED